MTGIFVGATGGLAFVLANAHAPLDPTASLTLRILAAVAFAVLVALGLLGGRSRGRPAVEETSWYGRGFWLVVAGEVALFLVGFQVLRVLGAPSQSRVGWIALVVGAHFVAFARLWREPGIGLLGVVLCALGATGLVLSGTSAVGWAPFASGVLSGFALLSGSLAAALTLTLRQGLRSPDASG
jgi:hypothetical protein